MTYIEYCDKCGKQIAGWNNEYGQVMTVTLEIESDPNHDNGIITGTRNFCSAACASEYLQEYVKDEKEWLDVWRRGKILGVAPVRPKKKTRSGE
jgi:hypothetical protein